ncbi:hypothetical protein BDZ89DRAFT_1064848 [Hymenopellis radicata]|nr:hypothetical protein BDZ89DRAFT_1064848 [Hymenopellis radicata]
MSSSSASRPLMEYALRPRAFVALIRPCPSTCGNVKSTARCRDHIVICPLQESSAVEAVPVLSVPSVL